MHGPQYLLWTGRYAKCAGYVMHYALGERTTVPQTIEPRHVAKCGMHCFTSALELQILAYAVWRAAAASQLLGVCSHTRLDCDAKPGFMPARGLRHACPDHANHVLRIQ